MKKTEMDWTAMEYEAYGLTEEEMRDMKFLAHRGAREIPLEAGDDG
jgi:hypothetical protein